MTASLKCRFVDVREIIELRARVLRAGKPVDSARFPEDDFESTLHFASFIDNRPVCCLTLIENTGNNIPTWQLRGMATEPLWQYKGVGRTLLDYTVNYLQNRNAQWRIWCNARIAAVPFYTGMGFEVISEPFDIPQIGLHYKMEKTGR